MEKTPTLPSIDEERNLLKNHEQDEEFMSLPIRRRRASFYFGHRTSFAISLALLLSVVLNLNSGYRYRHQVCVVNTQNKPYTVANPSYCEFCHPP